MATQTTLNTASPTTHLLKTFYDKKMLEWAKTQFVYANYGQKRSIPRGNGKTVEFRRWKLFDVDTAALVLEEGVTPTGQNIGQTKVEATVKQYGAYVEVSDVLDMTAYDPVMSDMSELLGEQMGTCLDWVTRDALIAEASAQMAGGKTATNAITTTDVLTVNDIRKAVRTLKKAKARKFTNGGKPHFVCIVDPDVVYDLQNDSKWEDVQKYQNAEAIYSGELGRMYGVVFVESTEGFIEEGAGSGGANIHHTLIFGADAYGVVDISGAGGIRSITKPFGSGGTSDPLDQRATIGCKVDAFTAKVLNPLWIIDIESAAS